MMRKGLAALCLAAWFAGGCGEKEAPPPQRPAPQVTIVTVQPQSVPYIATFVAQTESSQHVDMVARVSVWRDRGRVHSAEVAATRR
jgi:PBP1b-binding outer membrane lipoprotein LpoB